jgi:membrane protease YdiL (CAAX protease family)
MMHLSLTAFSRRTLTWVALCVYLTFRIGIVSSSRIITPLHSPPWVNPVYQLVAYLLIVFLICLNMNNLARYNVDRIGLFLMIFGMPLNTLLTKSNLPFPVPSQIDLSLLYVPISVCFFGFVLTRSSVIPTLRVPSLVHLMTAVIVGVAAGTVTGFLIHKTQPNFIPQHATIAQLVLLPVQQYTYAALTEEPFFRGFLWGSMREAGFKTSSVFWTQSALFWIAHIYYFNQSPLSFWIIVPIGAVIFGLLVWFSKSLSTSLIAHGLMNGVGQAIAYYTL